MWPWYKKQNPLVKTLVAIFVIGLGMWVFHNPFDAGRQIYHFFTHDVPAFADWLGRFGEGAGGAK